MALKFIDSMEFNGKRVIARFDFNVPLSKDGSGQITDTTRVDMALPTIKYILEKGASKLILMSHLGRPKGEVKMEYSLEPVAKYLAEKLDQDVVLTESCLDEGIKTLLGLKDTKIVLLQNLRFHPEETKGDRNFAKSLSEYAEIYVNDAFGTAHRKHASTYEINAFFPGCAVGGFILRKEIEALDKIVKTPEKPFIAILGGAKVSDKIKTIERLLISVDNVFIGGAMAYPFLKAKGKEIGKSLCADEDVTLARNLLERDRGGKILLPLDNIVSNSTDGNPEVVTEIPTDKMGLDIGPQTLEFFKEKMANAKTVFWNGPMGYFENSNFANGTMGVAKILSEISAFTLVGGGDSVSAVKKSGLSEKFSHVSTGGGASLEYIENGDLPGIQALKYGIN